VELAILFEQKRARFVQKRARERQRAAGKEGFRCLLEQKYAVAGLLVIWSFGRLVLMTKRPSD
jgi:hypothetical protein